MVAICSAHHYTSTHMVHIHYQAQLPMSTQWCTLMCHLLISRDFRECHSGRVCEYGSYRQSVGIITYAYMYAIFMHMYQWYMYSRSHAIFRSSLQTHHKINIKPLNLSGMMYGRCMILWCTYIGIRMILIYYQTQLSIPTLWCHPGHIKHIMPMKMGALESSIS